MPRMKILGIDPGSRRCGYGVVARRGGRLVVLESGVLVTGDRPMAERLARLLDGLTAVIARATPAEVAIEQIYAGISPRSALALGQARAGAGGGRAGRPPGLRVPARPVKLAFTARGGPARSR